MGDEEDITALLNNLGLADKYKRAFAMDDLKNLVNEMGSNPVALAQKIKDLQKSQADGAQWERDHLGTLSQDRIRIIVGLLKEVQDTVSRSPETAKYALVLNRYAGLPGQLPIFLHVDNQKITDLTPTILSALAGSDASTATPSK
jgi:hypothetical protein